MHNRAEERLDGGRRCQEALELDNVAFGASGLEEVANLLGRELRGKLQLDELGRQCAQPHAGPSSRWPSRGGICLNRICTYPKEALRIQQTLQRTKPR